MHQPLVPIISVEVKIWSLNNIAIRLHDECVSWQHHGIPWGDRGPLHGLQLREGQGFFPVSLPQRCEGCMQACVPWRFGGVVHCMQPLASLEGIYKEIVHLYRHVSSMNTAFHSLLDGVHGPSSSRLHMLIILARPFTNLYRCESHLVKLQLLIPVLCVHLAGYFSQQEMISLVPRPSTPPVFDRLQYAKTEGEGLGNFITW